MKIMICGPIGDGRKSEIEQVSRFLEENGFEVINQFEKHKMDYSHVRDFRRRTTIAKSIVEHDMQSVRSADVLVVLPRPSFGASIEMYLGKSLGKKVVLFSRKRMPSPWPVKYSDYIATSKAMLVRTLWKIAKKKSR